MNLFTLMATIGLDASSFTSGVRSATAAGEGLAKNTQRSVTAAVVAMGNLMAKVIETAGRAVISLGKTGLSYNSQMEDYTTNFRVMLGSQEAAEAKVAELREMAAKTPFGMEDLAAGTQMLLQYGTDASEVSGILSMLGDVSLGNKDRFNSLTLAFAQMSSTGKLTGQDLNQMIIAGFNPLQVIAEATSTSIGDLKEKMAGGKGSREFQKQIKAAQKEVKKLGDDASPAAKMLAQIGTDGAISAELVAEAFEIATSEGGQFYNGMEEASKTLSGQLSTLQDNGTALIGKFFEPLSTSLSTKILPKINEFVDVMSSAYDEGGWGAMLSTGLDWALGELGLPSASDIVTQVTNWWNGLDGESVYDKIKESISLAVGTLDMPTDLTTIADNAKTWWTDTAQPAITTALSTLTDEFAIPLLADIFNVDTETAGTIITSLGGLLTSIGDLFSTLGGIVGSVVEAVGSLFGEPDPNGIVGAINTVIHAVSGLIGIVNQAIKAFTGLFGLGGATNPTGSAARGGLAAQAGAAVTADTGNAYLGALTQGLWISSGMNPDSFFQGFDTGLDYVPYDDFAARLHEGEMVLTKLEADRYRRNSANEMDGSVINVTQNIQTVPRTVSELMEESAHNLSMLRFGWR